MFGRSFKAVCWELRVFQRCFRVSSRIFQGCVKEVSGDFQAGFKGVSRKIKDWVKIGAPYISTLMIAACPALLYF